MNFPKHFWWVVLGLVVLLVLYAVFGQRQTVEQVGVGSDGVTVRLKTLDDLPQDELDERQTDLENQLDDIQNELRQTAQPPTNNPTISFDLTGRWRSDVGILYDIVQFGDTLSIQEIHPAFGVTAVGEGDIRGQTVDIFYFTAAYTQGGGSLRVADNGREIEASFTDYGSGVTTGTRLYRQ